ncbi:MAG: glycosyltransferase family 39 protein [Ignavibacteria bacterium]|nr:glycosyltransferase family 39 protein [Ignavibacteria bacterium]
MSKLSGVKTQNFSIAAWITGTLLLIPLLFFPFGQDQATFFRAGLSILNGGSLYVDFIDVKPPLIYYFSALAIKVFGPYSISLRIMEFIWMSLTIAALTYVVCKHAGDKKISIIASVLYAVLHLNLNASQTYQTESLFVLLALVSYELTTRKGIWYDVAIGLCLSLVFLSKYTLAIVALPLVLYWFTNLPTWQSALLRTVRVGVFSFSFIAILVLPFVTNPAFWVSFPLITDFLKAYSTYPPYSIKFLSDLMKTLGAFLGDRVSILVVLGMFATVWRIANANISVRMRNLTLYSIWMIFFLLITVVIERKLSPYQMSRLFLPITILSSAGLYYLHTKYYSVIANSTWAVKSGVLAMVTILVMVSPIPRYVNVSNISFRGISDVAVWDEYLTRMDEVGMDKVSMRTLQTYLNSNIPPDKNVFVMSMMATSVLPFIDRAAPSVFADPHFYTAVNAPIEWKKKVMSEVVKSDWLVIDTVDYCTATTLHFKTSWQCAQQDPLFESVITSNFDIVDTIAVFVLLKHK